MREAPREVGHHCCVLDPGDECGGGLRALLEAEKLSAFRERGVPVGEVFLDVGEAAVGAEDRVGVGLGCGESVLECLVETYFQVALLFFR